MDCVHGGTCIQDVQLMLKTIAKEEKWKLWKRPYMPMSAQNVGSSEAPECHLDSEPTTGTHEHHRRHVFNGAICVCINAGNTS